MGSTLGKRATRRISPRRAPRLPDNVVSPELAQAEKHVRTPQGVVITSAHDTAPSGVPVARRDGFAVAVLTAQCAIPSWRRDELLDLVKVVLERARGRF